MRTTSSALTGKSSRARPACGDVRRAALDRARARHHRQLAEQELQERRLPAAVGPEHGEGLPGVQRERHAAQRRPARRVARDEPGDLDEGHRRLPHEGHGGEHDAAEHGDRGARRQVRLIGEPQPADPLGQRERDAAEEQAAHRPRQEPRRRARDHEQRGDEQRADRGQRRDDGERPASRGAASRPGATGRRAHARRRGRSPSPARSGRAARCTAAPARRPRPRATGPCRSARAASRTAGGRRRRPTRRRHRRGSSRSRAPRRAAGRSPRRPAGARPAAAAPARPCR